MIGWIATGLLLWYIAQLPLYMVITGWVGPSGVSYGFGLSIVSVRRAQRRARIRKRSARPRITPSMAVLRSWLTLFMRHGDVLSVRARGTVGGDDALRTALITGTLQSIVYALQCRWGTRIASRVGADFSGKPSCGVAQGIVTIRLGHTLQAAAIWVAEFGKERSKQRWKNIPLKAS